MSDQISRDTVGIGAQFLETLKSGAAPEEQPSYPDRVSISMVVQKKTTNVADSATGSVHDQAAVASRSIGQSSSKP